MSDLKSVFETIAVENKWGDKESVSGAGSTLAYTYNLRHELADFVRAFEIGTLFDAPCGDFNWMRAVDFPPEMKYIGGEIVPALVEANSRNYGGGGRTFIPFDITRDEFPACDLWFCRDCLFHLPYRLIFEALTRFARSSARLVMMTNHINATGFENRDIESGQYRQLDFYAEPFALPRDVLYQIPDYVYPFPQREMCVWSREQIAKALQERTRAF